MYKFDQMLKFTYELQRKSDFINDSLNGNVTIKIHRLLWIRILVLI